MQMKDDDLRLALVYALLRQVWQSFDSGGESLRSSRSRALEDAMSLLPVSQAQRLAIVGAINNTGETAFFDLVRESATAFQHDTLATNDQDAGLDISETMSALLSYGADKKAEIALALAQHGWRPEKKPQ